MKNTGDGYARLLKTNLKIDLPILPYTLRMSFQSDVFGHCDTHSSISSITTYRSLAVTEIILDHSWVPEIGMKKGRFFVETNKKTQVLTGILLSWILSGRKMVSSEIPSLFLLGLEHGC
ncbi:MAG: hypothetical protein KGY80_10595 [Candidatus Thorarchaeota archaeon]|nr:hypothetical protein [Candidatus Thorarchaeota archaeon]